MINENARATAALKECWKHRLQVLKKDLGYDDAPLLEKLLIQQAALCGLKLNLVELSYSSTMAQSITLTLGIYWGKAFDGGTEKIYSSLRDTCPSKKTLAQCTRVAVQYSHKWRAAGQPGEVSERLTFLSKTNTLSAAFTEG